MEMKEKREKLGKTHWVNKKIMRKIPLDSENNGKNQFCLRFLPKWKRLRPYGVSYVKKYTLMRLIPLW